MKTEKTSSKTRLQPSLQGRAGFSLIVTVTIMILLSLIAVGLLSLSSTVLRASSANDAQIEARGNARLAAQMAIAKLQGLTGLDTRVTASAKLVNNSNIDVAGVWRSWEGTDNGDDGEPSIPDYDSKEDAGDPAEALETGSSGRFLGYLTSTAFGEEPDSSSVPGSGTTQTGDLVKLVSTGTVETGDGVFLEPTLISNSDQDITGSFSWWTSGDNSKALVNVASENEPEDAAEWQERVRGNRLPDPDVLVSRSLMT